MLNGDFYALSKKFENEIENFDQDDIDKYMNYSNWRARWFFHAKRRFEAVLEELQRIQRETGQEPRQLGSEGVKKVRESLPDCHQSLWEKTLVTPQFFNSITGFVIIVLAIGYAG